MRKRFWLALAAGGLVGGSVVAGFGPFVEARVADQAERYGAKVEIDKVRPSWSGVRLKGVNVTIEAIPGVRLQVADVLVGWSEQRLIGMQGAEITAIGSIEELLCKFESWRDTHLHSGSEGGAQQRSLTGLELRWRNRAVDPSQWADASGLTISRDAGGLALSAKTLRGQVEGATFEAKDGLVRVVRSAGQGYRIKELSGGELTVEADLGALPAAPAALGPPAEDPPPEPKPEPELHPRVKRARDLVHSLRGWGKRLNELLPPESTVAVQRLSAQLVLKSKEVLTLGPGMLGLRREPELLELSLTAPEAQDASRGDSGLTFAVRIPLDSGASKTARGVELKLRGGPLWLSLLGVRDGDWGIKNASAAALDGDLRLVLSPDGQQLSFDGYGKVEHITLASARLASEPITDLALSWRAKADVKLDGTSVRLHQAEVNVGDVRLLLKGSYERLPEEQHKVDMSFEVPLVTCQSVFDALPKALVPKLTGMRFVGSLGFEGHARFDTTELLKTFDVDWDGTYSCRVNEMPPALSVERFKQKFSLPIYTPKGDRVDKEFGRGTPEWVAITAISRHMDSAALICEDGRFYHHNGFDKEAIINSIRENLKERRFFRGASTISMQLAKNLYLSRDKTLSRKLQEAVLTTYLEQHLTKREMMELYLNVIEFGPMIYGIGPAARHYFSSHPARLSLGQALYLGSILREPHKHYFGAGGAVIPSRMRYLRQLMKIAHKIHRISDEELEEAERETVVFGSPAPIREEPEDPYEPDGEAAQVEGPTARTADWLLNQ